MRKTEEIMFAWIVIFTAILFVLALKYPNYGISVKATIAALLTSPFAFVALYRNTQ
jgi:hypothetical protein